MPLIAPAGDRSPDYRNFTKMNPLWNQRPGFIHIVRNSLPISRTPRSFGGVAAALSPMAPTAPNLWRRPCYANSRLLQLPRHRWVRPRWRRLPLPPGAVTVGTTVDGTAAGAVPASSSVAPPIMAPVTAAAMCGDWSRRHGGLAGGWWIAAIDPNRPISTSKAPAPSCRGFQVRSNGTGFQVSA